jgi:hypothetical protein
VTTFKAPPGIGVKEIAWPPGSDNVATYTHAERLWLRGLIAEAGEIPHVPTCRRRGALLRDGVCVQEAVHDVERCRRCQLANQVDCLHQMKVEFGINIVEDDPDIEDAAAAAAQTTIFDIEEGERLRDEAIERVDRAAPVDWKAKAVEAVRLVCVGSVGGEFSTDDVWEKLAAMQVEDPPEHRAMAGVMAQAKAAGWCEMKVGSFVQSRIPRAHRRNTQVWISRL